LWNISDQMCPLRNFPVNLYCYSRGRGNPLEQGIYNGLASAFAEIGFEAGDIRHVEYRPGGTFSGFTGVVLLSQLVGILGFDLLAYCPLSLLVRQLLTFGKFQNLREYIALPNLLLFDALQFT